MSHIIVFHGIDHKAGCTMVSQSVAELIAKEKKELAVLFAALNGRRSAGYVKEKTATMDDYKIQLKSGIGVDKNTLSPTRKTENLYIVAGVEREEEVRYYLPDMAQTFIESLCKKFDLLIIDAGSEIDNGLAFGALKTKSLKYLIMEQCEGSLTRHEKMKEIYERLDIGFDRYVINKHFENDPLTVKYVSSRLNVENALFMCVSNAEGGRASEMEYRTLLETAEGKYRTDILKIANDIMAAANFESIKLKRKRAWNSFM